MKIIFPIIHISKMTSLLILELNEPSYNISNRIVFRSKILNATKNAFFVVCVCNCDVS